MDHIRHRSTAEVRQLLDLVVKKTSALKATIEDVQCMAIDAALSLMDSATGSGDVSAARAERQIADSLNGVVDELTALLRLIRYEPTKPGTPRRLQ